jgi:hypothetical protein
MNTLPDGIKMTRFATKRDQDDMPAITSVTFDYRLPGNQRKNRVFFYDQADQAVDHWLNEPGREFNTFFHQLVQDHALESGTVAICWDDGIRASLPIPVHGRQPDFVCVGDLIECIANLLVEFKGGIDEGHQNLMYMVAQRAGRMSAHEADPTITPAFS